MLFVVDTNARIVYIMRLFPIKSVVFKKPLQKYTNVQAYFNVFSMLKFIIEVVGLV
jgi:hypothetical protein